MVLERRMERGLIFRDYILQAEGSSSPMSRNPRKCGRRPVEINKEHLTKYKNEVSEGGNMIRRGTERSSKDISSAKGRWGKFGPTAEWGKGQWQGTWERISYILTRPRHSMPFSPQSLLARFALRNPQALETCRKVWSKEDLSSVEDHNGILGNI